MSEFKQVFTVAELNQLDQDDICAGYRAGMSSEEAEPGSDKSRGYWHGWRNAMADRGLRPIDGAQVQLAREIVGTYRGLQ